MTNITTLNDLPIMFFATGQAWKEWLAKNYAQTTGIWIKFGKKNTGVDSLIYDEALESALCYGWIDGQAKTFNKIHYLQKFTPRRSKSIWSKRSVDKATQLIQSGMMKPSGLAAIDAAKEDGRWAQAYDSFSNSTVPPDFQAALEQNLNAKAFFETLSKTNRYAFLWRIQTAKKPETRAARITLFIEMLREGKTYH